jgi:sugar lactone lactonase YvrE
MGIDGVRYFNGTLYFTNVSKNTFHKVSVDATGKMTGSIATIWSNTFSDDLWVGPDGTAYVATGSANKIQKVTADGKVSTLASISGATSCTLGRTEADKNTLYIATSSGAISSVKV